jgi:hypothetical protein
MKYRVKRKRHSSRGAGYYWLKRLKEPEFLNLLRSPGMDSNKKDKKFGLSSLLESQTRSYSFQKPCAIKKYFI